MSSFLAWGVEVQGVYIAGDGRHSEKREIQAINDVVTQLSKKNTTVAKIQPIKIVDKSTIPSDEQITKAFNEFRQTIQIGSQYEWIARYAKHHPGIELGAIMPDGEFSGYRETINKYGGFVERDGSYYLDQTNAPNNLNNTR